VRFGLERNLDVAVQRLFWFADIAIAQAYTAYRPTVTTDFARSSTTSAPTNQLSLSSGGGATTSSAFGFNGTVVQPLPWQGGNLRATLQNSRSATNSNNATFNPSYTANWTLNYAQPLVRGREIDATRRNIVVTKINRDVTDIQLKAQLSNLVSDIRNAYLDYVYAVQAVDVAKQSLELSTKLVEDNKIKVEIGTMAPLEITPPRREARSEQGLVRPRTRSELGNHAEAVDRVGHRRYELAATLDRSTGPSSSPKRLISRQRWRGR
jgi:outer membrane protein TolC